MEEVIGIILLCITASFIIGEFFDKLKLPRMLGGFIVGMTLGLPQIKELLFSHESLNVVNSFGLLGDIFIMFYIGLNIDFSEFKKHSRVGFLYAMLTYLIPFAGGMIVSRILGYSWMVSFLIAGCITLISEDVPKEIMKHMKMGRSKILHFLSRIMLGGSFFEVLFLTAIFAYSSSLAYPSDYRLFIIIFFLILFILMLYIARYLVVPFVLKLVEEEHSMRTLFLTSLIVALFMASLSTYMGLGDNIGALMGGLIVRHILTQGHHKTKIRERDKIDNLLQTTILSFFTPFFFIYIGLMADWTLLIENPGLGILITAVAFFGKIIATFLDFLFRKIDILTSLIAGIGINSKGAIELIAATVALKSGMIDTEIFSAIVFMTFFLSMLSPILFTLALKHLKHKVH